MHCSSFPNTYLHVKYECVLNSCSVFTGQRAGKPTELNYTITVCIQLHVIVYDSKERQQTCALAKLANMFDNELLVFSHSSFMPCGEWCQF